ncbi:hypothetical protein V1264_014850 [Littorina saxatilis]
MLMKLVFVVILVGRLAARGTNIRGVLGRSVAHADAVRGGPERRAVDDLFTPSSTTRLDVTAPLGSIGTTSQTTASVSTPATSTTPSTSSPATTSTVTATQCQDVISTCSDYKQESCVEYKAYMAVNCPRFCGFCSGSGPVCRDRLANCVRYSKETCLAYANFRDTHCRAYCDNCDANVNLNV